MALQEVGNSLSFPTLSLKRCFIRGKVLPLLLQASNESVLQAHGAGAAEGAAADLLPQRDARHSTLAGRGAHREDEERVPDPPHGGLWVPAGPVAMESAASPADSGINSAYA